MLHDFICKTQLENVNINEMQNKFIIKI